MRILVIEDERKVAQAVRVRLEGEGYEIAVAETGTEGAVLAREQPFDLIVLDLMLPGQDGLDILSSLRSRRSRTPVLVLTAKDTVQDRAVGLDAGADDYLVKPFAF